MFLRKKKSKSKQSKTYYPAVVGVLLLAISVSGMFIFRYVEAYVALANAPIEVVYNPNLGVRSYVVEFFTDNDAEEMLPIIACESGFRHFEHDGTVLKNREGSSAVGVAQILTSKHPDPKVLSKYNREHNTDLIESDFDLTRLRGNLGYALVLYEIRGTRDWECSRKI